MFCWKMISRICTVMSSKLGIILTVLLALSACEGPSSVRSYIFNAWESTLRYQPEDTPDSLIGMPFPYTVPCAEGMFNEIYYWDTFFTNAGLIEDGKVEQARFNTSDLLYLVQRYGFVPNGNRLWYLNRSQPPYLARMVADVFDASPDTLWLAAAWQVLELEYAFWMTERAAPCGLNHYGGTAPTDKVLQGFISSAGARMRTDFRALGWDEEQLRTFGLHCIAECESGWDYNPRFERRCADFCPVDLNANLFGMEKIMQRFATILGKDPSIWEKRAESRRELIRRYLYDAASGQWFDYDYVAGERSQVVSAAVFSLLFNEVLAPGEAATVRSMLPALEYRGGLAVCADAPYQYDYQWSYPNAWPPTTFIAVEGLLRYGYRRDARRLARKYIRSTTRAFRQTGQLWEKTDCRSGQLPVDREYGTPAMLGWTAGTFVHFYELLNNNNI